MPAEKKPKTSSAARDDSPVAPKLVIDLNSSKSMKDETNESVLSGSPLERFATIKSDKVPLPAKVVPKYVPYAAETNSSAEKNETARAGSREKSTKFVSGETAEICVLLKPDMLKDMDVCAKFFDGVK
ncbi:hypothetical protein EV2_036484 [Malus domestica]